MSDPILLVVKSQDAADKIQRLVDPNYMYVIGAAGSLMGRRFSGIINTVSENDFPSEMAKESFRRWSTEHLPCRLMPGGVLINKPNNIIKAPE